MNEPTQKAGGFDDRKNIPLQNEAPQSRQESGFFMDEATLGEVLGHPGNTSSRAQVPSYQEPPATPPQSKKLLIIPWMVFIPLWALLSFLLGITASNQNMGLFIPILIVAEFVLWYQIIVCIIAAVAKSKKKKQMEQSAYLELPCPHCQKRMRVPRGGGQNAIICPHCQHGFTEYT